MTIEDFIALLVGLVLEDREELNEAERTGVGMLPALFIGGRLTPAGRILAETLARGSQDASGEPEAVEAVPSPPVRRLGVVGPDGTVSEAVGGGVVNTFVLAEANRVRLADLADLYGISVEAMLNVAVYEFYDSKTIDEED